jgi:hypothetical protein
MHTNFLAFCCIRFEERVVCRELKFPLGNPSATPVRSHPKKHEICPGNVLISNSDQIKGTQA